MARKFRSVDDFERHLRNKCGVGEKENYKPWFTVRDVKDNKAFRKEIMGTTIIRRHHLLSAIEYELFLIMDFRSDVVDIREQFPLFPLSLTRKIALTLDVEHPMVVGVKPPSPFVMTTDLLVTFEKNGIRKYVAFCVKPEKKLSDPHILEKIEIERVWWESIGVTFKIFSGNEKTKVQSHNILWATDIHRHGLDEDFLPLVEDALKLIPEGKSLKYEICGKFSERFNLDAVDALNLLRLLIGRKFIEVDLSQENLDRSTTIEVLTNKHYQREYAYAIGS